MMLMIAFSDPVTLYLRAASVEEDLFAGTAVRDRGHGHLTGFYDWLWSENRIVGVRFWPTHLTDYVLVELAAHRVAQGVVNKHIDVHFVSPWPADATSSSDQEFGGQIVDLPGGTLAITFVLPSELAGVVDALRADSRIHWGDFDDAVGVGRQ